MSRPLLILALAGLIVSGGLAPLRAVEPVISEFCADNETILADEDGRSSDWIEILNPGSTLIDLAGYHLTDNGVNLTRWTFPSRLLAPGETLIVFASGKGRAPASGELHTNFQLNDAGEYLALVAPDGSSVVQEFAPSYPRQYPDVSFGIRTIAEVTALVAEGAMGSLLVPESAGDLPADWATNGFPAPDATGPTAFGFQENPLAALRPGLLIHSTMDNADTGTGSGTDDSALAAFTVGNSEGVAGSAISDNASGSVTSGATGTIREALDFSNAVGGNRRVTYGNNFDIGSGSYTVSLWINSRIATTGTQFIASKGNNSSAANGWGIWAENNTLFLRGEYTGSDNATQNLVVSRPFGASEQGAWHHIALVIDNASGTWTGYYDGLTSGASGMENGWTPSGGGGDTHTFAPGRDFSSAAELLLGVRGDLAAEWLGTLDDFLVWNRALDPGEITTLYANGGMGLTIPAAGGGGANPLIATDIGSIMRNVNASAFVHLPFTLDGDPAAFNALRFRMRSNDGYVAHLNGTEIARRNAPPSPDWNATAEAPSPGFTEETLALSDHTGLLQSGANVLALHGLNAEAANDDFLLLPALEGTALTVEATTLRYFTSPSPGALNSAGVGDLSANVTISPPSGTFTATRGVTLAADALPPGAVLRYTTDGTDPTEASPAYTEPILLAASAEIRARALVPGEEGGFVSSAHYLRLAADVQSFASPLPIIVIENLGAGPIPNKRAGVAAAGDGSGITQVPRQRNFIQIFGDGITTSGHLANTPDIATRAGLRVRGSSSANQPAGKQNLSVETWSATNGISANIAPFGMPTENDWVLYAPYNYDRALIRNAFVYELMRGLGRYAARTRFVEVFLNPDGGDLQLSDFVGFYVFMEKIKADSSRVDIAPLSSDGSSGGWMLISDRLDPRPEDGSNTAPFSFHTAGPNRVLQGPYGGSAGTDQGGDDIPTGYNTFFNFVEPGGYDSTAAQRESIIGWFEEFEDALYAPTFDEPATGYRKYLHVGSAVDHFIIANLTRNVDDLQLSTYLYRPDTNGKLHLNPVWDYDRSIDSYDSRDNSTTGIFGNTYLWYPRLFDDPDFSQEVIDRWQELRRGSFSTASLNGLIDAMAAQITEPVASANFAKWNAAANTPRAGGWPAEIQHMKDWLGERAAWIDAQYVAPVAFNQDGGAVPGGFALTMSSPSGGMIYYTLDGSDPRALASGDPPVPTTPSALAYAGAVSVDSSVVVTARALVGGEWSGPTVATFLVETVPASADNLVISEIMYHPSAPNAAEQALGFADRDEFEFLELRNISASDTLDLTGVRLVESDIAGSPEGVAFDFSGSPVRFLAPGDTVLVVENADAFAARYGASLNVAGEYAGALANGGETLSLLDAADASIRSFAYDDAPPWPSAADGLGYSLVLVNPNANPDHALPESWRPSVDLGGNPGGSDSTVFSGDPDADEDRDQLSAFLEYALGTSDDSADSAPLTFALSGGGDLILTYRHALAADDSELVLEISTDLEVWDTDSGDGTLFTIESRAHNGDATETVTVRLTENSGIAPQIFARLHARTLP